MNLWSESTGRVVATAAIAFTLLSCGSDAATSATTNGTLVPASATATVTVAPTAAASTTAVTVPSTNAAQPTTTGAAAGTPLADQTDWNVCANRFAFETLWIQLGKSDYSGARQQLLALGPQPGLDDPWQGMLRSLDDGTDPLDSIGPVLDYYKAIRSTPCDPQGLPAGFGCDLVDDCVATLASDPAARDTVASPRVVLNIKDPAKPGECGTGDAGGQRCFIDMDIQGSVSTQMTLTFTQTTGGRYFVSDIHN